MKSDPSGCRKIRARTFEEQLQSHMETAPLPSTCTGYWQVILGQNRPVDYQAVIHHDGDTCPIHELGVPRAEQ